MNFSSTKTAFFACLLIGGSALGMEPGNNAPQQKQVAPGHFEQKECPICMQNYSEFVQGQCPVLFPCEHWVCNKCLDVSRCPLCRAQIPISLTTINVADNTGRTRLHKACYENYDGITWLLEHGANVNATDQDGDTPLHYAVDSPIAKKLIDAGARVNATNNRGQTPLHVIAGKGGKMSIIKTLIEAGAYVNAIDYDGNTPLHRAAALNTDAAEPLLAAGAYVAATNREHQTPLCLAIGSNSNSSKLVKVLIAADANVNEIYEGHTLLYWVTRALEHAIEQQSYRVDYLMEIVKLLRDAGAR